MSKVYSPASLTPACLPGLREFQRIVANYSLSDAIWGAYLGRRQ